MVLILDRLGQGGWGYGVEGGGGPEGGSVWGGGYAHGQHITAKPLPMVLFLDGLRQGDWGSGHGGWGCGWGLELEGRSSGQRESLGEDSAPLQRK